MDEFLAWSGKDRNNYTQTLMKNFMTAYMQGNPIGMAKAYYDMVNYATFIYKVDIGMQMV
jgi:hypothetical protein